MKIIYLPILALVLLFNSAQADPIDKVAELIGKGNVRELVKLFAPSVEINMADAENVYSKTQAEIILDKFFAQNKASGGKVMHRVNSNAAYRLGVVIVTTDKGPYRIAFTLKGTTDADMQLIELRIEPEKGK